MRLQCAVFVFLLLAVACQAKHGPLHHFINGLLGAINSRSEHGLGLLMTDTYYFEACDKTFSKKEIIDRIVHLPADRNVEFAIQRVHNMGDDFSVTITVTGLRSVPIDIRFDIAMWRGSLTLIHAKQVHCEESLGISSSDDILLGKFLDNLLLSIRARSALAIGALMSDSYVFKACERNFSKEEIIDRIVNLPADRNVDFDVTGAKSDGRRFVVLITVTGLRSVPIDIAFEVSLEWNSALLINAQQFNCNNAVSQVDQRRNVLKVFLDSLLEAIRSRSASAIGALIDDRYIFQACERTFSKEEIIQRLVNRPANRTFDFNIRHVIDRKTHYWVLITVTGLRPVPIDINFNVEVTGNRASLIYGIQFNCQKSVGQVDQRKNVLKVFLDSLLETIRSRDPSAISAFIDDRYIFQACERTFSKEEIIQRLVNRPANRTFDFNIRHVIDRKTHYWVLITVTGLRPVPIDINFNVEVSGNRASLIYGIQFNCHNSEVDQRKNLIKVFLDKLLKALRSRSAPAIGALMKDSFTPRSCEKLFSKDEIIQLLVNRPADTVFDFDVKRVIKAKDYDVVDLTVTGLRSVPIDIRFAVDVKENGTLLIHAHEVHCEIDISIFVDESKNVLKVFLDTLLAAIRSRSPSAIGAFIDDKYIFRACERTFSKDEIIKRLVNRPADRTFDFDVKHVGEVKKNYYLVDITVTGLRPVPIDIRFVVTVKENSALLVYAQQLHCQNNTNLVDKTKNLFDFLDSLLGAMRSRSASAIGALISDSYVFEACERNFSKDEIIERIVNLPADRNIEFNVTAYKENAGHFTVLITVTGLRSVPIDIAFDVVVKGNSALLTHAKQFNCQNAVSQATQTKSVISVFLDSLLIAIRSRDAATISAFIDDRYIFRACERTFSKEEIVQRLVNRPADRTFDFDVKRVVEINEIYYLVDITVTGLRSVPIDIRFAVGVKENTILLVHAKQLHCPNNPNLVDKTKNLFLFLDKLLEAMRSRSAPAIGALMTDSYVFEACERNFSKDEIIQRIVNLPADRNIEFNVTAYKENAGHFTVLITVTGLRSVPIDIAFDVVVKGNSALSTHAKQFNCQNAVSQATQTKSVINDFLDQLLEAIRSRSPSAVSALIYDKYVFEACDRTFSKEEIIQRLVNRPANREVEFDVIEVIELPEYYLVDITVTGLRSVPIDIRFGVAVAGNGGLLIHGKQFHCQKSVGQVDQRKQVLLVFLSNLLGAVRSRSAAAMGALMSDSYYYNACERIFTKEQIIERMVQLPAHRNVDFNITSIVDKGEHFVVDITVTGVRSYPIAIAFKVAVSGNRALLIHAKQFNCHRKPFIEPLSHFDQQKDVITQFLDNLQIAVQHHFARSLGNLITDIFVYKSCEGNVSKEDFIKHIMSLPKTQRIDFDIQSVQETQDNYMATIKITGLYAEPVDILFEVTKYMRGTVVMLTGATQLHCS